ncbi:RNA polymerase sigma factor [Kineococcus xinjiangensis]|uniref:RNA polymerase sigma factor n=1 Tax=Kineococcus xinjiangensis TaxID=512762 RepID=UPI001FE29EFE|nr:sigma-70 family RNA polymerase sigma factor [Kineococcus xinjiangensis]
MLSPAELLDVEASEVEQDYRDLFTAHFVPLTRLARLCGADDPEDIAQEAPARLHQRMHRLQDPAAALAYARRSVINLSTSRLRRLLLERRTPGEIPREVPSPETQVLTEQRRLALHAALQQLPARQRHALLLRYWLDLPVVEVAAVLDCRVGSAKSILSRAHAALSRAVEP